MLPAPQPFRLFGFIPDGGPGPDDHPAIPLNIAPARREEVLRAVRDLILTATGPRDGQHSAIQPESFDAGIRAYLPEDKFAGTITPTDRKMYACRVAHRLMNAITGRRFAVRGSYRSEQDVEARADGLYQAWRELCSAPATPTVRTQRPREPSRAARWQLSPRQPAGADLGPALWRAYHAALFSLNVLDGGPVLGRTSTLRPETFDEEIRPRYNVTSQRRAERGVLAALKHLDSSGIRYPKPSGSFASREQVALRARSILDVISSIAGQHGIDPYTAGAATGAIPPRFSGMPDVPAALEAEEVIGREHAVQERGEFERRVRREAEERLRRELEALERRAREDSDRLRSESEAALQRARDAELRLEREEAARREAEQRLIDQLAGRGRSQGATPSQTPLPTPAEEPAWAASLADPGAKSVFLHIAAHGSVTEAEAVQMLGSARALRRFSVEFELHAQHVPFLVRVEPAEDGSKRYVREGAR